MKPGDFITWILVSDASRARLFSTTTPKKTWHLRKEFDHPSSREKSSNLGSDRPGRVQQSGGHGTSSTHSAMTPDTDPKEVEIQKFAHELGEELNKAFASHEYAKLVLVAPPHFLGLLRKAINTSVERVVSQTFSKEYTALPLQELMERVVLD